MTFTIRVANISWTIAPKDLRRFAREQGKIKDAVLFINKATGLSRGTGLITYEDRIVAERLLGNQNITLGGRTLRFSRYFQENASNNNSNNTSDKPEDITEKQP